MTTTTTTTMATTTTSVGGARARRTPHVGFARHAQTRAPHITRTRARIDSKDPWWEKPCPENMKECESTMEFLNLLVRASSLNGGCFVFVVVVVA